MQCEQRHLLALDHAHHTHTVRFVEVTPPESREEKEARRTKEASAREMRHKNRNANHQLNVCASSSLCAFTDDVHSIRSQCAHVFVRVQYSS